jgi:cobalt-zinc-cadmium efflux system membrane fusion protein
MKINLLLARTGRLVAAGFFCAACTGGSADEKTAETPKAPVDLVTLTPAQAREIGLQTGGFDTTLVSDEVAANGVVDVPPMHLASVSVPIGGYVRSVLKLPGSPVSKGETLATLESLEYVQMQQDYAQARSRLQFQREELDRQTTLNAEEVGARRRLQQARADYEGTRALVGGLETKLRLLGAPLTDIQAGKLSPHLLVKTPIAGNVQAVNVTLGKNVNPTDVLFEVIGTAHKHLELKVFEKDAFKIQTGQKLLLTSPQFGARPAEGSIYLVGKALEGEAKTLNLHGHVTDPAVERRLLPGMYIAARILTGSRRATTLPDAAIVSEGDARFIFVQEKALTFRRIPVKVGRAEGGRTEIFPQKPTNGRPIVRQGAYLLQATLVEKESDEPSV